MFILIFFLIMSFSQFITNKVLNIDSTNSYSYTFNKKESLVIVILFIVSIALQIIIRSERFWLFVLIYAVITLITLLTLMAFRKVRVERWQADISQTYAILKPLVDPRGSEVDFNEVPFELGYNHGKINKIKVDADPTNFKPDQLPIYLEQLNSFFPDFTWTYELQLQDRYFLFIGENKAPLRAEWKGSWLRPANYFPMGVSGKGEVGWQIDEVDKNSWGRSLYTDKYGKPIPLDKLPKMPQSLISGSTGGGKSITVQDIVNHCIEHRNKIAWAGVDIKQVEFSNYKDTNGAVGIATDIQSAVELLRIAKIVMYQRNKEFAKLGIKQLNEYVPTKKSGKVFILGREYYEDDMIKIRHNGVEKEVTAKEVVEIAKGEN